MGYTITYLLMMNCSHNNKCEKEKKTIWFIQYITVGNMNLYEKKKQYEDTI